VAGHEVYWRGLLQKRFNFRTDLHYLGTAGMKAASGWRIQRTGHLPLKVDFFIRSIRMKGQGRGEEDLRIGVKTMGKDLLGRPPFH
jgi:hypothetical protein